jgi:hypothetical protein
MSWIVYDLGKNIVWQKKLQEEVDQVKYIDLQVEKKIL